MESSCSTSEPPTSILDLPFDCLEEVGQYLEPRDVTHIMATNWGLRSLVANTRKHFPRQPVKVSIYKSAGVFEIEVTLGSTVHVGRAFDASVSLVDLFTKLKLTSEDLLDLHSIIKPVAPGQIDEMAKIHDQFPFHAMCRKWPTATLTLNNCDMRDVTFTTFYYLLWSREINVCVSSMNSLDTADAIRVLAEEYFVTKEEADTLIKLKEQGANLAALAVGWIKTRSFPIAQGRGAEWMQSKEEHDSAASESRCIEIRLKKYVRAPNDTAIFNLRSHLTSQVNEDY